MRVLLSLFSIIILQLVFLISCEKDKKKPIARFTVSKEIVEIGDTVMFTNQSENALSYFWSFGDGINSTDENPKHSYSEGGFYVVILKANNSAGESSISDTIKVSYLPSVAEFQLDKTDMDISEKINLTNLSKNSVRYLWKFGDGVSSEEFNPSYSYSNVGIYTITLISFGVGGDSSIYISDYITVSEDRGSYRLIPDIDGNIYKTVFFGTQEWMVENLKTSIYNDGSLIPLVVDKTEWSNTNSPAYCWFSNNLETYSDSFGALYNWFIVDSKKICPSGWHVPTKSEWEILITYFGGHKNAIDSIQMSDFKGLNSGSRGCNGNFGIFNAGFWWTSDDYSDDAAYGIYTGDIEKNSMFTSGCKNAGFSIRCVKD